MTYAQHRARISRSFASLLICTSPAQLAYLHIVIVDESGRRALKSLPLYFKIEPQVRLNVSSQWATVTTKPKSITNKTPAAAAAATSRVSTQESLKCTLFYDCPWSPLTVPDSPRHQQTPFGLSVFWVLLVWVGHHRTRAPPNRPFGVQSPYHPDTPLLHPSGLRPVRDGGRAHRAPAMPKKQRPKKSGWMFWSLGWRKRNGTVVVSVSPLLLASCRCFSRSCARHGRFPVHRGGGVLGVTQNEGGEAS